VFRLIKLAFGLVGLAAFAWFGITVKLGDQTLFQHLRAIGGSKESQELFDGTRQAAGPLVDDVRRHIAGRGHDKDETRDKAGRADARVAKAGHDGGVPQEAQERAQERPQERLSARDQQELRPIVRRVER
jgi:hypothetical protein